MTKKVLFLVFLFFILPFQFLQAQQLEVDTTMCVTNGIVRAIAQEGNTLYLGGDFDYVGPNTGGGAILNTSDGKLKPLPLLMINGYVRTSVSDGKGGWYIGGDFSTVQGVTRHGIAHILGNGLVDKIWKPILNFRATVHTMLLVGNTLYVGGDFAYINGHRRENIAAFDTSTGKVTPWILHTNSIVSALAASDNQIYIGGRFTQVEGLSRRYLVSVDLHTRELTIWDPKVDSTVSSIEVNGNTIYVGGAFKSLDGKSRNSLVAIDALTNQVTAWNPSPGNNSGSCFINAIAFSGNTVFVGGSFNTVGGQSRNNLAAVDAISGQVTPWNPSANNSIMTLLINNNILYAGGVFTSINGYSRQKVAAIDVTSGNVTLWNPNANNTFIDDRTTISSTAQTLSIFGNDIFVGGNFISINGQQRNRLASIDLTTNKVSDWDPKVISGRTINSLAISNKTLYVGGKYDSIGGQSRLNLAAIDLTTMKVTPWNPRPHKINGNYGRTVSPVNALAIHRNILYIGGSFDNIGGQSRNNLAAIDITTGQVTPWNPDVSGFVHTIALTENTLYAGGDIYAVGDKERMRIAAINITTGEVTPWNPTKDHYVTEVHRVWAIAFSGNTVFVGGAFKYFGQTRNNLAAVDATTGQVTPWNPDANVGVSALALSGSTLYVGGSFTTIGGQNRNRLVAIDAISGQPTSWNPDLNGSLHTSVHTIVVSDNKLYVGGDFKEVSGRNISYFASFKDTPPVICHTTNTTVAAGANRIVCEKDTVLMQATAPLQGKGRWHLIKGAGKIQERENPYTLIKDLVYGENLFEWRVGANTCGTDSLKARVSIQRIVKPATPAITQKGADSLYSSIAGHSYEWLLNGKAIKQNAQTILVKEAGAYTVIVKNNQGCSSDLSASFAYVPTGITAELAAQVKVYPNPTNGYMIVELPASVGKQVQLTINDALGRNVYERKIFAGNTDPSTIEIDLSAAQPGMFVLRINTDKGAIVKKVFKR